MVCGVVLLLACLVSGIVHVNNHVELSPFDEYVYIDYLTKVPSPGYVPLGDPTSEQAREYLACHGVRTFDLETDGYCALAGGGADSLYPYDGVNTADIYTPAYFWITRAAGYPLVLLGIDVVEASRFAGALWLSAGVVMAFAAFRRLGASRSLALGGGLALAGSLSAYWSNTYVSTDGTSIFAGGLLLLLGVHLRERTTGAGIAVFAAASAFVTILKVQNALAVGAVALWLIILAISDARKRGEHKPLRTSLRDPRTMAAVAGVTFAVGAQVGWMLIRSRIAVGEPGEQGVALTLTATRLFGELFTFFPGVANGASNLSAVGGLGAGVGGLVTILVVVGMIGLLIDRGNGGTIQTLAFATLVVAMLGAPALALVTVLFAGYYVKTPSRYATALLPLMIGSGMVLFSRSQLWVQRAVLVLGVLTFGMSLGLTETP